MITEGIWLSISDYSRYKNVSVSTIRRHIKQNVLRYREENGKYLIYVPSSEKLKLREEEEILRARLEVELLRTQLRDLKEENDGLRMLVQLYESSAVSHDTPPALPANL
jgi:hypothetical protein